MKSLTMRAWNAVLAAALQTLVLPAAVGGETAPANTWVETVKGDAKGARLAPIFFLDPASRRIFRASGGGPGVPFWNEDANNYNRYDTEELDLLAAKWINAYPPGTESGRPASGPLTGYSLKPMKDARAWLNHTWLGLDGDQPRLKNWPVFHQWAYVPERKTLYVCYGGGGLVTYDAEKRSWAELKCNAEAYKGGAHWCSLCYDPVNKELVQVGGQGGEQHGTWIFDLAKNEWRMLECGSPALKALSKQAADLRWRAIELLGAAVNRFTVAETEEESKADLATETRNLSQALKALGDDARNARAEENEMAGASRAAALLDDVSTRYASAAAKPIDADVLGELRALKFAVEQVCDAVAGEPPLRGLSPAVYDPEHQKIAVFGGDQLDRTFSDTWLYDCKTRRWEQRFPRKVPCPRAGHLLVWLPEAKRFFLAGGYSRTPIPQDIWTYDVGKNEWHFHGSVPLKDGEWGSKNSPGVPNANVNGYPLVGVALPGDVVVSTGPGYGGAMTLRADVTRTDPAETEKNGVAPASYTLHPWDPGKWEKLARPNAAANVKFLKELPANQWHAFKFPAYAPGATNRWGTAAYDYDRHQFLLWTGGHASSWENEVDHFSILGSVWTISYPPDASLNPTETLSAWAGYGGVRSFLNRAVPGHSYHYVAYGAGTYFFNNFIYDVRAREWRKPGARPVPDPVTFMLSTPHGAVAFDEKSAAMFDAKSGKWEKLPWEVPPGPKLGCDQFTAAYDSKRDCIWTFSDRVVRYDFKSGKVEQMTTESQPKAKPWFLCRESVCIPDADLVLSPLRLKSKEGWTGWAAWDLASQKYLVVEIPRNDGGNSVPFGDVAPAHAGLVYDPEFKVVLLNDMFRQSVWAMRFDRKTAKIAEAE